MFVLSQAMPKIIKKKTYLIISEKTKISSFKFFQKNSLIKNSLVHKAFIFFYIKNRFIDLKKLKEFVKMSLRLKFHLYDCIRTAHTQKKSFKKKLAEKPQKKKSIKKKIFKTFKPIDDKRNHVLMKKNIFKIHIFFNGKKFKIEKAIFKKEEQKMSRIDLFKKIGVKNLPLKFSKIFKMSEFIKNYSVLNLKNQRLKNFSNFWDEARWITKTLFTNKKFLGIYKEKKNLRKIFEEIYIFLILLQSKKIDFCEICLKSKRFLSKFSLFFFFQTNVIMKIFYLDNNWNEIFKERERKKNFFNHYSFNSDISLNNLAFLEKINNNFVEITDKRFLSFFLQPLIYQILNFK